MPQSALQAPVQNGDPDEWMAPPEVAAMAKLTVQTLANYRHRGVGPPFTKLSPGRAGRIRYRRLDVVQWLTEGLTS